MSSIDLWALSKGLIEFEVVGPSRGYTTALHMDEETQKYVDESAYPLLNPPLVDYLRKTYPSQWKDVNTRLFPSIGQEEKNTSPQLIESPESPKLPKPPKSPKLPKSPSPKLPKSPKSLPKPPKLPKPSKSPKFPKSPKSPKLPKHPKLPKPSKSPKLPKSPKSPKLPKSPKSACSGVSEDNCKKMNCLYVKGKGKVSPYCRQRAKASPVSEYPAPFAPTISTTPYAFTHVAPTTYNPKLPLSYTNIPILNTTPIYSAKRSPARRRRSRRR